MVPRLFKRIEIIVPKSINTYRLGGVFLSLSEKPAAAQTVCEAQTSPAGAQEERKKEKNVQESIRKTNCRGSE